MMNVRYRVRIARVRSTPKATAVSATPATNPLIRACARPILVLAPVMLMKIRANVRPIPALALLMRKKTRVSVPLIRAIARVRAILVLALLMPPPTLAHATTIALVRKNQSKRNAKLALTRLMRRHIRVPVAGNVAAADNPVQGTILGLVNITTSIPAGALGPLLRLVITAVRVLTLWEWSYKIGVICTSI